MKNADQPAFPIDKDILHECGVMPQPFGLSKREYFAAMAMQGICSNSGYTGENLISAKATAEWAIEQADELLRQLES